MKAVVIIPIILIWLSFIVIPWIYKKIKEHTPQVTNDFLSVSNKNEHYDSTVIYLKTNKTRLAIAHTAELRKLPNTENLNLAYFNIVGITMADRGYQSAGGYGGLPIEVFNAGQKMCMERAASAMIEQNRTASTETTSDFLNIYAMAMFAFGIDYKNSFSK
jgi:hypothetical protein